MTRQTLALDWSPRLFMFGLAVGLAVLAGASVPAAATATQSQSPSSAAPDPDEKIKCRKHLMTGSLVRKVKLCRTVAEWRRFYQESSETARALVGENVCSGGECRGYEPKELPE
jgi:hypothetical protein